MEDILVFPAGSTVACQHAARYLNTQGLSLIDHPSPEITHLLLDVPSFAADGSLRGGGALDILLERLPQSICVIGGNLNHPGLEGYSRIDLLQDTQYAAENASITAQCALQVAAEHMEIVWKGCPALVIGWGRIGKCLGQLLNALGADVTIAARKDADRAMVQALGLSAADTAGLSTILPRFRLVFNTVPELMVPDADTAAYKNAVLIDLASRQGIKGSRVIWARGLPGILAAESSGTLIAQRILDITGRN